MRLTKPMIRAFEYAVRGENTLARLAKALNCSISWADMVVNSLEKEGFITRKGNYSIKGSRIIFEIANTPHALKMNELFFQYPGISFEEILADSKLLFLSAISEDWMDIETAVELSKTSKFMIDRYMRQLKNRGVVTKSKQLYKLNEKAWPVLKDFLIAYRNYSEISGNVKWKYNEEVLFEVNNENSLQGSSTGFYKYKEHGLFLCYAFCLKESFQRKKFLCILYLK